MDGLLWDMRVREGRIRTNPPPPKPKPQVQRPYHVVANHNLLFAQEPPRKIKTTIPIFTFIREVVNSILGQFVETLERVESIRRLCPLAARTSSSKACQCSVGAVSQKRLYEGSSCN